MFRLSTVGLALICVIAGCSEPRQPERKPVAAPKPPYIPAASIRTNHYVIHSSAAIGETTSVAMAVESLYRAYGEALPIANEKAALHLVLYRDQLEFKRNNRASPWAEAYYRHPYSFAYPGNSENPYHWMLHEATHQLIAEAAGHKPRRWLSEGIASYFGTSTLSEGKLDLGRPDPTTYPIWWLTEIDAGADSPPTFQGTPLFSLKSLVEDTGPPIAQHVNHYYVAYWSLVHYLFHGDNGIHRESVPALLQRRGEPAAFAQLVGAYDTIEPRWHAHLVDLARSHEMTGRAR
ncbi:MAG: DUF1570 domain-containing protein [Xanthomonadales bacterium]|nr:DUF1570 domain-containing protein [Xanthomonadales bacterium]MBK7145717.1 DUF1570 domain-containing protein [Xanthomonadales bacterium]MCC6563004.1 DUF1570 domain-containing protein [Xanthomonadales bacterium]